MIYAICNPIAGSGRGKIIGEIIEKILNEKKLAYIIAMTERPGHATELAREACSMHAETILAIGGDGTSLEVARGMVGRDSALGIIPAGTGNDFVKTLGVPLQPIAALEYILDHPAKNTDVGEINGDIFLNEIGTGIDVSVLDYAAKAKKTFRGILPYLYGVVMTMFHFHSISLTYSIDGGEKITMDAFVLSAANGGKIGGGIPIAPQAKVDDGKLDVAIVGKIKSTKLISRLIGLMRGKILSFPETQYYRAKSVTFTVPEMRVNIDGEIVREKTVTARVLPGALKIHR
ncbi:MAG: diacylglycerol kinase family lipid kinase [Clostridia bacterium]|nr:diacylglycerol kinase family lipid kinase [Clostridia bacterium]